MVQLFIENAKLLIHSRLVTLYHSYKWGYTAGMIPETELHDTHTRVRAHACAPPPLSLS